MGSYLDTSKPLDCIMDEKSEITDMAQGSGKNNDLYRSSYGSIIGKNILKHLKR